VSESPGPLRVPSAQGAYEVEFEESSSRVLEVLLAFRDAVFIVDRNVGRLHPGVIDPLLRDRRVTFLDATEEEKTLNGAARILTFLQDSGCVRKSLVVAIGGGITQDVTAFAAHIYYQGAMPSRRPVSILFRTVRPWRGDSIWRTTWLSGVDFWTRCILKE
jgi:3-dehydroquinate synthase